jgi:hypothetical protein
MVFIFSKVELIPVKISKERKRLAYVVFKKGNVDWKIYEIKTMI